MYRKIINKDGYELLTKSGITLFQINDLSQKKLVELGGELGGKELASFLRKNIKELNSNVAAIFEKAIEVDGTQLQPYLEYGIDKKSAQLLVTMNCTLDSIARTEPERLALLYNGGLRQAQAVHLFLSSWFSKKVEQGNWQVYSQPVAPEKMSVRVKRAMGLL